jgi:hypothetical protein
MSQRFAGLTVHSIRSRFAARLNLSVDRIVISSSRSKIYNDRQVLAVLNRSILFFPS